MVCLDFIHLDYITFPQKYETEKFKMTVPIEFEGGLLQNDEIFKYLAEVKSKIPDVVQDTATKKALMDLKKEINANINEIDLSEKKQTNELIQIFRDKNFQVWEARSDLEGLAQKISEVNKDFDERRRKESFDAIDLYVKQANVTYQLTGSRWELTTGRFVSVDALTVKGELKKSIVDKIDAAALQAQSNIEQERLLEAARLAERDKQKELERKEQELRQREQDVQRMENQDTQAIQKELEQERSRANAKAQTIENIQRTQAERTQEVIARLTNLENKIDPDTEYTGKSVLKLIKQIKGLLK